MVKRGTILICGAGTVVAAGMIVAFMTLQPTGSPERVATPTSTQSSLPAKSAPTSSSAPYVALTAPQIEALPEAKYNAVIPGLIAYNTSTIPAGATYAYTIATDIPIYGARHAAPVARFAAKNFMLLPSVIVPVKIEGAWALVLTPARQELPSQNGGHAPAQTVGWVRTSSLIKSHPLPQHIVVSVSAQTVSIVNADGTVAQKFPAGVGTPNTPTPTGVIGYLQARYTDPSQGEGVYPIQLTSLHATEVDNPYLGHDGGLIGLHYNLASTGAVSHGCVRLAVPAIRAITGLPLGTLITITP